MKFAACIFIKVLEVIFTLAATISKKLLERFSERLVVRNKKNLAEWMLLNTIAITKEADDFGDLTYIGFLFICTILLLARIKEKKSNYHITEITLLSFGILFFIIQALLIFGIIEELPDDILPYSYSLGAVTFLCALLFAIDLFFFKEMTDFKNSISQTDVENVVEKSAKEEYKVEAKHKKEANNQCCRPTTLNENKFPKYLRTDL